MRRTSKAHARGHFAKKFYTSHRSCADAQLFWITIMIDKNSFMPLNFFKKTDYLGSLSGLRYRLGKAAVPYTDEEHAEREKKGEPVGEDEQKTVLRATVWEGPFSYGKHDVETEYHEDFPFTEEGIGMAADWINGEYERDADRWQQVPFWTPQMSRDFEAR